MRRYSPSLGEADALCWAAYLRQSASPGAYAAYRRMNMENDVRGVLSAIHTQTLVAHRAGDRVVDVDAGRHLADRIPGATFRELRRPRPSNPLRAGDSRGRPPPRDRAQSRTAHRRM